MIGIVGNMNNAYFSLIRYLRDKDCPCKLLIFPDEPPHFDPSCDTYSDEYRHFCKKLSWGDPAKFLKQDFDVVRRDLDEFDFLVGNGPAPAFAARAGRKLDIFMPYGYDLYSLPFIRMVHPFHLPAYLVTTYFQRKGIRESNCILFDRANEEFETVFARLNCKRNRIVCPNPMIYYKEYENSLMFRDEKPAGVDLGKLRDDNDLLFVQHTRQVWKKIPDRWSGKGNDELIKGYAKFLGAYSQLKSRLILFEYGTDVAYTKKLIRQLGIEPSVIWMPKMPRKKLINILAIADLVIGELSHSWLTYGVALEALALGKPLMHYRKDAEFEKDYPELYPMLNANNADTVLEGMNRLVNYRRDMIDLGQKGREWFLKYCVERPVNTIIDIIRQKQADSYA